MIPDRPALEPEIDVTPEMIDAGADELCLHVVVEKDVREIMRLVLRAALAAAPSRT